MDASSGVRTKHIGKLMMQEQPKVDDGTSGGVPVENVARAVLQYGRCDVAVFALTLFNTPPVCRTRPHRSSDCRYWPRHVLAVLEGETGVSLAFGPRLFRFSLPTLLHCHGRCQTPSRWPASEPGEAFDATEPSPCGASSGLLFLFRSRSALLRRPSPLQSRHLPFCSSRSTWNLMRLS